MNVAIASAVTAYSRVYMSNFKNRENINLYYSDTDSIFIDRKLNDEWVGDRMGQFKLENIFKEIVFLGPKIYAGMTSDNEYVCKVKGYKNPKLINFFKKWLNRSTLELSHENGFRSLQTSEIEIKSQLYNLTATENKRSFIRDENNLIIDTHPFKFE